MVPVRGASYAGPERHWIPPRYDTRNQDVGGGMTAIGAIPGAIIGSAIPIIVGGFSGVDDSSSPRELSAVLITVVTGADGATTGGGGRDGGKYESTVGR